jgi:hypothetical protein
MTLVASFTDDQKTVAFAKHFCGIGQFDVASGSAASSPFTDEGFRRRLLFESLMRDTQEALPLYLALRTTIESAACGGRADVFPSWDFRLIKSYYAHRHRLTEDSSPRILNMEIMAHLCEMLESKFQTLLGRDSEQGYVLVQNGPLSVLYEYPLWPPLLTIGDAMDLS